MIELCDLHLPTQLVQKGDSGYEAYQLYLSQGKPSVSVDHVSKAYFPGAWVNPWEQSVIVSSDV